MRARNLARAAVLCAGLTWPASAAFGHEGAETATSTAVKAVMFVAMGPSDNVAMIDLASNRVMRAVAGPVNPHGLAVTPDGATVYTTSRPSRWGVQGGTAGGVTAISLETGRVVATVDVGGASHHAWMAPDGDRVYVTVPAAEGIAVIDTARNEVIGTVETGYQANSVATSPDGKTIYVVNKGDDRLVVIDAGTLTVTGSLEVGRGPDHIAVGPDGRLLYITAAFSNELIAVRTDPLEIIARTAVGRGPHGVAVSSDGRHVYAASRGDSSFAAFEAPALRRIESRPLGKGLGHVAMAPGLPYVYVNDEVEPAIYVYDPAKRQIVDTIRLWPEPHEADFHVSPG